MQSVMATKQQFVMQPQQFNYFLVLDFEATCEKDKRIQPQVLSIILQNIANFIK